MKKYFLAICTIVLVASITIMGCTAQKAAPSSAPAPASETPKIIKLGAALPLSGPAAPWGIPVQQILQMQIDDINSAGGFVVGGQKYNWQLVAYDHQYTPTQAISVVKRLVELDKVKYMAILGTECTIPAQPIYEPAQVITWAYSSGGKKMLDPSKIYTFQYAPDPETAIVIYNYLATNKGAKRVAILQPDDDVGAAQVEFAEFAAKQSGLQILTEKLIDRATTDFYAVLTPIVAQKPDLLDVAQFSPNGVALIIKQARELGYKGPIFSTNATMDTLVSIAGWDALENYYTIPYLATETPQQAAFHTEFVKKYGENAWAGSTAFTAAAQLPAFMDAMKGAGTVDDTAVVAKYLTTMTVNSLWGPAHFGGSKYYGIARVLLLPTPIGVVMGGKMTQAAILSLPPNLLD